MLISGNDLFVSSRAAVVFGMIFHELTTNAAKHGGLAAPSGTVAVKWKIQDGKQPPALILDWQEASGSNMAGRTRDGFGLKFIERSVAYELRGQARLNFRAKGLHVAIRVPLAEIEGEPSHPAEGDGARLKSPR